ncbi:serine/threonine protein phosphatase [Agrobacterium rubi]|nr:serine/threonine protein phosphatase [Agrobacterium rubi]NTF24797.1 serine/threonine protein phosphatase [Agrobacterium rubi]
MTLKIATIPEDVEIVVIGDVHGRADLLMALVEYFELSAELDSDERFAFVFLGDLIDRGPESAGAIKTALEAVERHPGSVIILGNHEEWMRDVASGPDPWHAWDCWYYEGGAKTLASLGISAAMDVRDIAQGLNMDETVQRLLAVSVDAACDSRRIYAHAGIRPHVPLDEQRSFDLRWIRRDFIESRADHGRTVVHGHTITESEFPELHPNRVALDTGAFLSGRLTAAWFKPDGTSGFVMAQGAPRYLEDNEHDEPMPIRIGPVEPVRAD